MKAADIETGELIAELRKRLNLATYQMHRVALNSLAFEIEVEQQDAELRMTHAHR